MRTFTTRGVLMPSRSKEGPVEASFRANKSSKSWQAQESPQSSKSSTTSPSTFGTVVAIVDEFSLFSEQSIMLMMRNVDRRTETSRQPHTAIAQCSFKNARSSHHVCALDVKIKSDRVAACTHMAERWDACAMAHGRCMHTW
jgi:hypothetical protein